MQRTLLWGLVYLILFIVWLCERRWHRVAFALFLVGVVGQIKYLGFVSTIAMLYLFAEFIVFFLGWLFGTMSISSMDEQNDSDKYEPTAQQRVGKMRRGIKRTKRAKRR